MPGSALGMYHLSVFPEDLKKEFQSIETLTEKRIDEECEAYLDAQAKGTNEVKKRYGGDSSAFVYSFSKVLVHALLRVHSRMNGVKGAIFTVADPGYCATDLSHHQGVLSAAEGGSNILAAVNVPQDPQFNGTMWSESKQSPFIAEWPESLPYKPQ